MAATTTMSPLRHYSPLREMIIDNCALFMKMPPSHIMIITEKSPAGQIVACAMVRGVAPGTVVCSDPSGDLDSALASLHDKSMRTVHCHRGGHGVQHHVSNRRPRLAPRDYSDDEDWLSDYDVLSETSDDTAMADWQDEEGSDTDDDAAQVSTPATTRRGSEASTPNGSKTLATGTASRPSSHSARAADGLPCLCRLSQAGTRQRAATTANCSPAQRMTAAVNAPAGHRTLQTPVSAARPMVSSLVCPPAVATAAPNAGRDSHALRGLFSAAPGSGVQHRGQPQRHGLLGPAQPKQTQLHGQGARVHTALAKPPPKPTGFRGPQGPPLPIPSHRPNAVVPSPLSVEDRVFDIVFSANWEGRGQHQFLARSPAGIKALQVAVLDYCRKYPTAFPGQVTPAKAVEQKSPKMPITTTASGMDHEDGSTLADDGGARSNGDSSSGSPAAKVAAGTTLQGSAVVSTAAGMPRPSPYEQRHSVTVWWNGGILTAKIRSAGSGDSAVKYDVKAYSGDSLAPFFRMISQSGKVPTVEVDIDFSGRSADATIMH